MKIITEFSWVSTIESDKLKENSKIAVYPMGLPVLLIKKAGKIYAISNKCAHMACPLAGGNLDNYVIICPCHDWKFDIRTGEFLDSKEIKIPIYQIKLKEGNIFIKI